jgi:hypothetical protein
MISKMCMKVSWAVLSIADVYFPFQNSSLHQPVYHLFSHSTSCTFPCYSTQQWKQCLACSYVEQCGVLSACLDLHSLKFKWSTCTPWLYFVLSGKVNINRQSKEGRFKEFKDIFVLNFSDKNKHISEWLASGKQRSALCVKKETVGSRT